MTELERMLKEALAQAEQLLRESQTTHAQTLRQHSRELTNLKNAVSGLQAEQTALNTYLAEHSTRLNAVYESLHPLLMRLNALLPGK